MGTPDPERTVTERTIGDATHFTVDLVTDRDQLVLVLGGEADLVAVPLLDGILSGAPRAPSVIVVDVSALEFVDCAVIGWVAGLTSRGYSVRVAGATGLVARVLDLVDWREADRA